MSSTSDVVDVAVIGGGIVGLATAHHLLATDPDLRVALLEKEPELARHQSQRNSGVIHSGVYYTPGSFKARLCLRGRREMEEFADVHGVPRTRPGKLIVATTPREAAQLEALGERARANGVSGLRTLSAEDLRETEPQVAGCRALLSPTTGSIDFREVSLALARQVEAAGGTIHTARKVTAIQERPREVIVQTRADALVARHVVACAGLHADRVARRGGEGSADAAIVPFRGSWLRLTQQASRRISHHIYPVPDPRFPFLGVHASPRVTGEVWVGPNAVLAPGREAYHGLPDWRDLRETLAHPGFLRLARRHWRQGASELWQDQVRSAYLRQVRRYLPDLGNDDVLEERSTGIRAQAITRDGDLVDDFVFDETPRVLHVRNAPSPAATASLSIGRLIADRARRHWTDR